MKVYRLLIVILLVLLAFTMSSVIAQEATAEPEATEAVTEVTVEPEVTTAPEATTDPESTSEPTEDAPDAEDTSTYVVRPGDNLFRIALRFGVSQSRLAEVNGIANPSLIFVGQTLIIPTDGTTTPPQVTPTPTVTTTPQPTEPPQQPGGTYVVRAGDNLYRIAILNGTTVSNLLALNPNIVNPNLIFVGQSINLPGEETDGEPDAEPTPATPEATESADTGLDVMMETGVEVMLGDDYAANASLVTQLGLDWVKMTVNWAEIETEEGVFDFNDLDSAIAAFESGFDIMLTLTGAPDWARPSATDLALQQPGYGPPDDMDTFATFAGAVASRYAGQVDAYVIWYQPNIRLTWMTTEVNLRDDGFPDAGLSDVRYIDLLEAAYTSIKEADADALVLTAGLAPTGWNDGYNAIRNDVFLTELLRQGAANFSDGYAVHVEGFGNPPDATCCGEPGVDPQYDESYLFFFADVLDDYRTILDNNGEADQPLWVTRFGWGTTEGASNDGTGLEFVQLNTAQEQSEYVADAFLAGDARGDVGAMVLYNLNGCSAGNANDCYYSMIDTTGAARPVFGAVASLEFPEDE